VATKPDDVPAARGLRGAFAVLLLVPCMSMAADRTKEQLGNLAQAAGSYYGHTLYVKRIIGICAKSDAKFSASEAVFMKRHKDVSAKAASIKSYIGAKTGQPGYLEEVLRKAEKRLDADPSLKDLSQLPPDQLRAFCDRVPQKVSAGALDFRSFEPSNYRLIMEFEQ
jgi:hypothetical protein